MVCFLISTKIVRYFSNNYLSCVLNWCCQLEWPIWAYRPSSGFSFPNTISCPSPNPLECLFIRHILPAIQMQRMQIIQLLLSKYNKVLIKEKLNQSFPINWVLSQNEICWPIIAKINTVYTCGFFPVHSWHILHPIGISFEKYCQKLFYKKISLISFRIWAHIKGT